MPPIVKETDTIPAATSTVPSVVRTPVASSADGAARPQPVALEVPVSVNGARTVEGSDKREPFSENTKTVLVFGNGAVIRLTSSVAPGQLLFLTNDKTKKEVVCQVVKSKNYRNVSGYVELEFTESVVGFWGMRFPNDRIGPHSPSPAPVAAGPVLVPPAAPKVVAPVAPAPVAAKPAEVAPVVNAPVLSEPVAPKPEATKPAPPTLEEFVVAATQQLAPVAPSPSPSAEIAPEKVAAKVDAPAVADSAKPDSPELAPVKIAQPALDVQPIVAAQEEKAAEQHVAPPAPSALDFSELSAALTSALPPAQKQTAPASSDPSMEELKQETARLQQQLAALLFTDVPAALAPSAPAAPAMDSAAVAATTEKLMEIAHDEPAPAKEFKPAAPVRPLPPPSLNVEEVKIPSWLEPLARNTTAVDDSHFNSDAHALDQAPKFSTQTESSDVIAETSADAAVEAPAFGSRYSHDEYQSDVAASGGSKKGMWIGIAAGVLLLAGGAAWYFRPASNSAPATVSAASHAAPAPAPAPSPANSDMAPIVPVVPAASSSTGNTPPVGSTHDAAKPATNSVMPADKLAALAANPHTAQPEPQPEPEQLKKPVIGNLKLTAPVVNRKASKLDTSESAPELDGQAITGSEGLGSIAVSSGNQPAAPLPVGGDVKPAVLLSSNPPVYPALAKNQHVTGDVKIGALIDANGLVTTMKILSGPTLLHHSAMSALKQWRYQPATLNGNAVPMHLTVTLQLRLQ